MTRRFTRMLLAAPLALALAHCASEEGGAGELEPTAQLAQLDAGAPGIDGGSAPAVDAGTEAEFKLSSSVVTEGGTIPSIYRCRGAKSPELSWTAGPPGTKGYAVLFQDRVNSYYHWIVYDIAADARGLPTGVPIGATITEPLAAKQGPSDFPAGQRGYAGPCFPGRDPRAYAFTVYALDVAALPGITGSSTRAQIVAAIEAHDLARATLNIKSNL